MSISPKFRILWPYLTIIALTLAFFYKLAFTGMIMGRGDIYAYFYPYWSIRQAAFMAGHIPLWTSDIFMGVPVLANSQVGVFYPPNWPLTPFDPPTAVTISLLVHIAWAMMGVYVLARSTLQLDQVPALVAALVFGLSGYMGAKAENINQLQALAWMPWLFLLLNRAISAAHPNIRARYSLLTGIVLALQLLAGHPQTVFITLLGLGIYGLTLALMERGARLGNILRLAGVLFTAGVVAVLLAAPQLIPMLELSRQSNRSGGLNPQQAMAFSLNPFVIGRGMLPSYDGLLFGEYIGYIGIIGLGLAVIGIFNPPAKETDDVPTTSRFRFKVGLKTPWIILAILGFGLALGLYNPIYWTLASLPGFSFFRVPARWLALFTLGASMLAGIGLQSLKVKRPAIWVIGLIVVLVGGLAAATSVTDQMAVDVIGPADPTAVTWVGWGLALAALLIALGLWRRVGTRVMVPVVGMLAVVELFAASRVLAYNAVLPPDIYSAQRFTISQLHAYNQGKNPPGRMLGISQLLFDPGDVDALTARYRDLGMSDLAIRLALVDTKMRELVAPNLPLQWGIPTVDGFDGGLLPTENYSAFTSLMLPADEQPSVDGRLREMLAQEDCLGACIPDLRWLNLSNTQYVVIDKVYDLWQDNVAYDTGLPVTLSADTPAMYANPEAFEATTVDVLYTGDLPPDVIYTVDSGADRLDGAQADSLDDVSGFHLAQYAFDEPLTAEEVSPRPAGNAPITIQAVTLVDRRTGDFQQLTPNPWERVLSSDIKLYQNHAVLPRAFLVSNMLTAPDTHTALDMMRDSSFDPTHMAVIVGVGEPISGKSEGGLATVTEYRPERIEIRVEAKAETYLLLTDAYYPGWTVTVNGQPATIERADVMFRAVHVPAGTSTVVFEYQPGWWPGVLIFGVIAWLAGLLGLGGLLWRRKV